MAQKTGKRRIRNLEKVQQALDLRTGGASYHQIATALGLSKTRAYQLVMLGLDELRERIADSAERVKALELTRLDAITLAHYTQRANPRNAEILLKAQERRAKLLGLDAPAKVAHTNPEGTEAAVPPEVRIVLVKPANPDAD